MSMRDVCCLYDGINAFCMSSGKHVCSCVSRECFGHAVDGMFRDEPDEHGASVASSEHTIMGMILPRPCGCRKTVGQ